MTNNNLVKDVEHQMSRLDFDEKRLTLRIINDPYFQHLMGYIVRAAPVNIPDFDPIIGLREHVEEKFNPSKLVVNASIKLGTTIADYNYSLKSGQN